MGAVAYDIVPPDFASTIESLSALGYTLESAILDLVDNSIDAGAGTIDLDFHRKDPASYIGVADDGKGKVEAELQTTMAIAAWGLRTSRSAAELGRFGMGLNPASFSEASGLSVWTRSAKNKQSSVRVWELERVVNFSGWQLRQSRRGWGKGSLHRRRRSCQVQARSYCDRGCLLDLLQRWLLSAVSTRRMFASGSEGVMRSAGRTS
jgi:hypothetical protein